MADTPRGLQAFFQPRGVAVVGASRTPGKVGHEVLRNLLFGGPGEDRSQGFQGPIVPVNPHKGEILGLPVCRRTDEVEGPIDLAVFAVPAPEVPAALDGAARRGARAAIVLSAGFFEMGGEGRRLGEQLRSVAQNTDLRLIGPNCTGLYSAPAQLNASFFSALPPVGPTSLISQSGAIAQAMVLYAHSEELGLRNVVSLGDKADVLDSDLLRHFGRDEGTRVIALYLESLQNARGFHDAVRDVAPHKPIVVLRGGRTGAGHRAAKLHEGIETVSDRFVDSALSHPGLYRALSLPNLLAATRALALQPPARGRQVAIVTNAGGAGVLAADAVTTAGLDVVKLRQGTLARLSKITPNPRSWTNPVDLLGDAKADRFVSALEVVTAAEEVDAILLVLTDQAMTDPLDVAVRVSDYARGLQKPIVATFVGQVGHQSERYVERCGMPAYVFPDTAVEGLRALAARGAYEHRLAVKPGRRRKEVRRPFRRWWR